MAPPACAGAAPAAMFAVTSGAAVAPAGPYVVLTGTLPANLNGSPITSVEVAGSTRGVRFDAARGVWSYLLAAGAATDLAVTLRNGAGATMGPLHVTLTTATAPAAARDLVSGQRMVGSWMFTWFTGDTSWRCVSAWQPVGGFATWDGSAAWARDQLLDQMDAHLDAIGLQLDTPVGTGTQGYRFNNIVHVVEAARGLLEEGVLPPRLLPFLDTQIISDHWKTAQGTTLDLASAAGRAFFYQHAQAYYRAAATALGPTFGAAGGARFGGRPAVAMWHSVSMTGVDAAAVTDFKARFMTDFGVQPYLIAHPNNWRNFTEVDEITQMVGPSTHFLIAGRDPSGAPTANVEAGFWNPTSNTFYLPRAGGTNFDSAWASVQAQRTRARHVWIDTWNETGEGSGIFAAQPTTYTAADAGPCGQFVNKHAESWATDARHYINVTRAQATAWNDAPDLDAAPLAHDVPARLKPGERRWLTVAMHNAGDRTWAAASQRLGLTAAAAAEGFNLEAPVAAAADTLGARFGGVARGLPGVFTALLTAPCAAGSHTLALQMIDSAAGPFGTPLSVPIMVSP